MMTEERRRFLEAQRKDDYIWIDSPADIETALSIAEAEPDGCMGGIVMPLKFDQQFRETLHTVYGDMRNTIVKAYCGMVVHRAGGNFTRRYMCHALVYEEEGYRVTDHPALNGTWLPWTNDRALVIRALNRYFGQDSFEDEDPDPLTGSVTPHIYARDY